MAPAAKPDAREDTRVLVRVKQLINLTSSSNEHEAMRAALQACKLIRKHGLDILDPEDIDRLYAEVETKKKQILKAAEERAKELEEAVPPTRTYHHSGPFPKKPPTPTGGPAVNVGYTWSGSWTTAAPTSSYRSVHPTLGNVYATPPAPTPPPAPSKPMTAPVSVKGGAKFAGLCKQCGKQINVGDAVLYQKKVGVWCEHTSCYQDWLAHQQGSSGTVPGFTPNPFGTP